MDSLNCAQTILLLMRVMATHAQLEPAADDVVDMTYFLSPESLYWPGLAGFNYTRVSRGPVDFGSGWLEDNDICGQEHQGSHMDAPAHFSKGKWRLHEIPPHRFFGPAVRINIAAKVSKNNEYNLQVADIQRWEEENGRIPDNSLVFVFLGWGKHHDNRSAFYGYDKTDNWLDQNGKSRLNFPAISEDAARWITANRNISGIATDGPSVGPAKTMMAHIPFLKNNIFTLESVANLDRLATSGDSVAALPIKIKDGSGAPVRIIAFKKTQISPRADDVIDLTYPLENNTIMWPGKSPFQLFVLERGATTIGNNTLWLELNRFCGPERAGTHLDAPAHLIKGSWRIHQIPPHTLIGPAIRLDMVEKAESNPDASLSVQDLETWESENGRIPDNAMVFLHTGWGNFVNDFEKYLGSTNRTHWQNDAWESRLHFPGFSNAATKWLLSNRKIMGVGIDTMSYDVGKSTTLPAHVALLGAKKLGVVNVANLDKLPKTGATVFVFPMPLMDGSGAPSRIVAVKNNVITRPHAVSSSAKKTALVSYLSIFVVGFCLMVDLYF